MICLKFGHFINNRRVIELPTIPVNTGGRNAH